MLTPAVYSYVVRYDSAFAPNPFYGYCTLATCKPRIRARAQVGDWLVGSGSGNKAVRRAGYLVYAMQVTEALTFEAFDADERFSKKKPFRRGSRKQSCGDNIYFRDPVTGAWGQRDSFHSQDDGTLNEEHVRRDTRVNRVLVSDRYVYFGGEGPLLPKKLQARDGRALTKAGIGESRFDDPALVADLAAWIAGLGVTGYQGRPFEWISRS